MRKGMSAQPAAGTHADARPILRLQTVVLTNIVKALTDETRYSNLTN